MPHPIPFEGQNCVIAEDQPEYIPLPALVVDPEECRVISCWELTPEEVVKVIETRQIWLSQLTFGNALQPQLLTVDRPFSFVTTDEGELQSGIWKESAGAPSTKPSLAEVIDARD